MSDTHPKGDPSEYKVGEVLHEIAASGVLQEEGVGTIVRIKHAKSNSDLDKKHVDFLVMLETPDHNRIPIPINVKSSERKRREFEEAMNRKGFPLIRSIAVKVHEEVSDIVDRVIQCLRTAVHLFKNGYARQFRKFLPYLDESSDERSDTLTWRHRHVSSKEMRRRSRLNASQICAGCDRRDSFHYFHPARLCH